MTQADSEVWDVALQNSGHHVDARIEIGGISWPRRNDDTIRLQTLNVRKLSTKWHYSNACASLGERSDDIAFHPAVEHDNMRPASALDSLSRIRRDLANSVILPWQGRSSRQGSQL